MKKKELRKEQAVRLKETMARRKEEKVVQQREEVDDLQKAFDDIVEDPSRTEQILATLDYSSFDELKKRLKKLKIKLGLVTKEDLVLLKSTYTFDINYRQYRKNRNSTF